MESKRVSCCEHKCLEEPGVVYCTKKRWEEETGTTYCCEDKCFLLPRWQVDGLACRQCECFGCCRCRCKNQQLPPPELKTFKVYKSKYLYTCCPQRCVKFHFSNLTNCRKCYGQPDGWCTRFLDSCRYRSDWFTDPLEVDEVAEEAQE